MKNRRFWIIAVTASLALAMLPAQATHVTPTFVPGDSNCASVGSTGAQVTVNEPKVGVDVPLTVTGGQILVHNVERKEFDFTATGVMVLDVVVKGSGSNHYDYGVTGISADDGLKIPNGNKLNWVHFCYAAIPTFSISGNKFEDANADGLPDEPAVGLEGWTIELAQGETVLQSTTTDGDGAYSFSGLKAGEYQVCEVLQPGWAQTYPGGCHSVAVGPDAPGVDFLNSQGVDMCEEDASTAVGNTSATFALVDECTEGQIKVAEVSVVGGETGDEIVFVPKGVGLAAFQGTLTFRKAFDDPELLILLYDPDGEGFDPVPACVDENQLPDTGDTWCYFGVDLAPVGEGLYDVTWQVSGLEDPRFK